MFEKAIIHSPSDKDALRRVYKELAAFRCAAAVKYIEILNLNRAQIETLYAAPEILLGLKKNQTIKPLSEADTGRD